MKGSTGGAITPAPAPEPIDADAESLARLRRNQTRNRRSVADLIINAGQADLDSDGVYVPGTMQ